VKKIFSIVYIFSFYAQAQELTSYELKNVTIKGDVYTFGPLSDNELHQDPIIPKIIKNRDLNKETLCFQFFNNQVRSSKGFVDLSEKGNFLYARYNWTKIGADKKVKTETINKRLFHDPKTKCHYLGNQPGHELYKVDGKKISPAEAKDIQLVAYTEKDGGLSIDMGKDLSLVKECKITEPSQTENSNEYIYTQLPASQNGYVQCQARFRCHLATSSLKFTEVQENSESIPFEFSGLCLIKDSGKASCSKIHPNQCADTHLSFIKANEAKKNVLPPSRFKTNHQGKGGSGASQ
jgi:hypothetical protein